MASLVHAVYYLHVVQDDSYISFRYATHLVDLGSLTFNGPGFDRTEGYSNLTWVLLLSAAYAVGVPPFLAAKALGLASLGAALLGTARLVEALLGKGSTWRFLGAAGVGSSACFASWSVQGLETPLVGALVAWSTACLLLLLAEPASDGSNRRAWEAGIVFGVLGISRPEAPLFGLVAVCYCAVALRQATNRWRLLLRLATGFTLPVLAQLIFRVAYYGRFMANTVYAKVHGDALYQQGVRYSLAYAAAKGVLFSLAYGALVLVAFWRSARKGHTGVAGASFMVVLLAAYTLFVVFAGGDYMRGFRFWMPVLPLASALGTWALASALGAMRPGNLGRLALVAGAILALGYSNLESERQFRYGPQGALTEASAGLGFFAIRSFPEGAHSAVGRWLRQSLPAGALVALSEAGIVPFESGLPVVDYLGLNDRRIADFTREERQEDVVNEVFDRNPAAIVMTGMAGGPASRDAFAGRLSVDAALQRDFRFSRYQLATAIPLGSSNQVPFFAFGVFVRQAAPALNARGHIVAVPNPVPAGPTLGLTTVSWQAAGSPAARVVVCQDAGAEVLFASGESGSAPAPWIQAGHSYEFRLYDGEGNRLAVLRVGREQARSP
jgi:hypothetical protein